MFTLIELPYKSLAPVISDQTLAFHHGKHLQAYVDNLNKLIAGTDLEDKSLEEIIVATAPHSGRFLNLSKDAPESPAIFNNAGQILNHNLYFTQFRSVGEPVEPPTGHALAPHSGLSIAPHSGLDPESPLAKQIAKRWGTLDAFKAEFEAKGVSLFGSGWVWLQANAEGELSIGQYPNADNPVAHGLKPILTFDVWEHAYYLDYQNRRAAHLKALWEIVDWKVIGVRYAE